MRSEPHAYDVHAERLVFISLALLAALPAIMTFARTTPPLIATIIALLLAICAWRDGSWIVRLARVKKFLLGRSGMLLMIALVFISMSLLWTPAPERGLRHLMQLLGSAIVIGILVAGMQHRHVTRIDLLMPVGLAVASLLVIIHFTMSAPVNAVLGVPTADYYLNRTAVAIALFSPVVFYGLYRDRHILAFIALAFATLVAISLSSSWSAKLAILAIIASAPFSLAAPRLFHRLVTYAMVLTLLAAPLYVGHINALIPQSLHDTVGYGSMGFRGDMWREYIALFWQKPILGFGMEASSAVSQSDFGTSFTEEQLLLLSLGHPHNAVVQIWFEFGLIGALIAASLVWLLLTAMNRLKDGLVSVATTTSVGIYTVAFVSHGAWQAWWLCLVGSVIFAVLLQRTENEADNAV